MPRITQIKPQKKNNRVNIYLDGKFGFGLDLENFVKLGLKVEQELTSEEVNKIVKTAEYAKTLEKLLRFAMVRPRSEKEINDWFRRKKVHESMHDDLFNKLNYFDLLGDEKFAAWWVDQRQRFRPRSRRILVQELKMKGIPQEIIKSCLEESDVDEYKNAQKILQKKKYKWDKYEDKEKKQKQSEYLARNGYSWDIVKEVVNEFE